MVAQHTWTASTQRGAALHLQSKRAPFWEGLCFLRLPREMQESLLRHCYLGMAPQPGARTNLLMRMVPFESLFCEHGWYLCFTNPHALQADGPPPVLVEPRGWCPLHRYSPELFFWADPNTTMVMIMMLMIVKSTVTPIYGPIWLVRIGRSPTPLSLLLLCARDWAKCLAYIITLTFPNSPIGWHYYHPRFRSRKAEFKDRRACRTRPCMQFYLYKGGPWTCTQ